MKRSILAAIASFSLFQAAFAQDVDPVAFLINGEEITKSEFEYIYRKNNSSSAIEKKSLNEYVDLFVNFKLKVAQAKDLWYDHSKNFKSEYTQYENQLTFPYLRDSLLENRLLHEAYERGRYEVGVSHILVSVAEDATDTTEAYAKINDIYAQLQKGASFAELAFQNSDCPSKKDGGDIGAITVFNTVYPFECMAYKTPVGSVSEPFRTRFGYHILKVNSKTPVVKDLRFSHIFFQNSDEKTIKQAEKICAQLKKGKLKFADAVVKYSEDGYSNVKGGDMGYIEGSQALPVELVQSLKNINKVGDYNLIKSSVGTHIVTITDLQTVPTYAEMEADLKAKMAKSDRGENGVNDVINRLKVQNNLVVYRENFQPLYEYVKLGENEAAKQSRDSIRRLLSEPLFSYAGNVYDQKTFYPDLNQKINSTLYDKKSDLDVFSKNLVNSAFEDYIQHFIWDTERDRLKKSIPEYRNLLNEYRDGLLLFEISSKKVWTKAAKDTEGLKKYFEGNKAKYKWSEPKYKGALVRCASQSDFDKVKKFIDNYVPASAAKGKKKAQPQPIPYDSIQVVLDREFNKDGAKVVKVTKGIFAKGANVDVDELVFGKERPQSDTKNPYPYVTTIGKLIDEPESYTDVKGPLTADYQNYLEEQWLEELRSKYSVIKYSAVINSIEE